MRRLRLLLRLVLLAALFVGLDAGLQLALRRVGVPAAEVGVAIVGCAGLVLLYRWLVGRLEKRDPVELALDWTAVRDGGRGALFGGVLFALVVLVVIIGERAMIEGAPRFEEGVLRMLAISLVAAVAEELVFRGVIFRLLANQFGVVAAVVVSAALFGGLHAGNPNASLASTVAIALEAGVLLGIAYAATGSIWFPIGIHFGWNFTEAGIFGATISGHHVYGIFDLDTRGDSAWTGGDFGLEASVPAVVICLLAAAVLAWRTRARARIRA